MLLIDTNVVDSTGLGILRIIKLLNVFEKGHIITVGSYMMWILSVYNRNLRISV